MAGESGNLGWETKLEVRSKIKEAKLKNMNLESQQKIVQKSQKELFEFLTDVANFKNILPDTLEEFESNEDSFKFSLKGMPAVRLKFSEKQAYDLIKLKATSI